MHKVRVDSLISVIIPVYNMVGKIEYCLNSLLNQTIINMGESVEIIPVDDCSTDNSWDVLQKYAGRYPDIIFPVRNLVNMRQGGARNVGFANSHGDWIAWIDADDWVASDFLEKLYFKAMSIGADMAGCICSHVSVQTMQISNVLEGWGRIIPSDVMDLSDIEVQRAFILGGGRHWAKLYKREVLFQDENGNYTTDIFPKDMFYEDNALGVSLYLRFKKYAHIDEPLYYYYVNLESTTNKFSWEKQYDRLIAACTYVDNCKKWNIYEKFKAECDFRFIESGYVNTVCSTLNSDCSDLDNIKYISICNWVMKKHLPNFQENMIYILTYNSYVKNILRLAYIQPILAINKRKSSN